MSSNLDNLEGVRFDDTPECLDAIAKIAPNGFSISYKDRKHPVLKIDRNEYHVGDYVVRDMDTGMIYKADADACQ